VHEVKRVVRKAGSCGVGLDELHRQTVLLGETPPRLHHPGFSVETNHPSARTNTVGQQVDDAEDATSHVDHSPAGVDPDKVKQLRRLLGVDLGLLDQVANLCRAVPEQVTAPRCSSR
jgi:hypothetical protein